MSARRSRHPVPRTVRAERRRTHARVCIACRRMRPKADMIRIVRASDGTVRVDRDGTAPGRGAYVCPEVRCGALARRRLSGTLRASRVDVASIVSELEAVQA